MSKSQLSVDGGRTSPTRPGVSRLSVRTLAALLDRAAAEAFAQVVGSRYDLVNAKGRILRLPEARYSKLYEVALEDEGATVYLDIPTSLAEERQLSAGDYVSVTGRLTVNTWQGQVRMRVDVCQLELTDSPEETERKRSEMASLQQVRALRSKRIPFPFKPELKVTVICAAQNQVLPDFRDAVAPVSEMLTINEVNVSMSSAGDIASAINGAEADILVLIRGGGGVEGFAVLDDRRIVDALGQHKAFRIVGAGHAGNIGVLDLVADHAANTPADAGTYLANQLGAFFLVRDLARREIDRLKDEQATAASAGRRRDEALGRLRAENEVAKRQLTKQRAIARKLALLAGTFAALLVAMYFIKF